ncbi:MAG: DUF2911 domain-containing protein [Reichenbachiella sp.]|uniref:DUF2911 domain-containing protein n=1 Tax=Reichenbachiella sp. TaxID=2184521 RepID=UPI003265BC50
MKTKIIAALALLVCPFLCSAQYHSLDMPQTSPKVIESQRLGITTIAVEYSSPKVNGREIWGPVVPMNGDPIPWRVGANMNTKIAFSTDVTIEGQPLPAGSYGLHAIPLKGEWALLFAKNDNLWGSYYLDTLNGVALRVKVTPQESVHSEQLDFEFKNRTDSTLQLAIEWEKISVPFTIEVDLNKTTIEHFRYQLKGATTYAWEAWDAAAQWCLNRNTNLEEALSWSQRSITGGYGGYAANSNFTNLSTQSAILWSLDRKKEADEIMKKAIPLMNDAPNDYWVGKRMSDQGRAKMSKLFFDQMIASFPDVWYVYLGAVRAEYLNGNSKKALQRLNKTRAMAPANYKEYLDGLEAKINKGETL